MARAIKIRSKKLPKVAAMLEGVNVALNLLDKDIPAYQRRRKTLLDLRDSVMTMVDWSGQSKKAYVRGAK